MFSNTAYEALYQYIGLELHSRFIQVITSHQVFGAILLLIFAIMFFLTSSRFFSRYLPGSIVKRKSVPLSQFARIIFCLFIGLSLLRVSGSTSVKQFNGSSWHENQYVKSKATNIAPEYQVSFLFDLISRSLEECARLLTKIVDQMFQSTHSELEAPDFFYKAVMFAGTSTISDPATKAAVSLYTSDCIERILPLVGGKQGIDSLDSMFKRDDPVDQKLATLKIERPGQPPTNCFQVKQEVEEKLFSYATAQNDGVSPLIEQHIHPTFFTPANYKNLKTSMFLVDHYLDEREGLLGIQKASQLPGGAARIYQYVSRFFGFDTIPSLFGRRDGHGAALAAQRAQEFSENLTRAPHVAGFIKMLLIAIFPWLVFGIVAGHFRILALWMIAYGSVLLWAPIWNLLYHVMMGVSLSSETLKAFGELTDGISLYSASLITSRMNYMYAVYSWLQLLVGVSFSGSVLWFARPLIADSKGSEAPEFIESAGKLTSTVGRVI